MLACQNLVRGMRAISMVVPRQPYSANAASVEASTSIPLVKLWKGIKKAPKVEKKASGMFVLYAFIAHTYYTRT
jgi:hypothetical protein